MKHISTSYLVLILILVSACEDPVRQPNANTAGQRNASAIDVEADTPAAQRLSTFINVIRTGEREAIAGLVQEHMADFLNQIPLEQHVDELMGFHEGFSHLVFHHLTQNESGAAEGLFYNTQTDSWITIGVEVEKKVPHKIRTISLEPAAPPQE